MKTDKTAKDFIIEGLLMLMAKKPYNEITITEIAERAGVNRVTFYRIFNTKDEVVEAHLTRCDELYNQTKPQVSEQNGLYQILKYFEGNRKTIELLYKSGAEQLLLRHILNGWHYTETKNDVWAYIQSAWAHFIVGWAKEWYRRGMKETPEELAELAKHLKS